MGRIEEIKSRVELIKHPQMDGQGYPSYWAVEDVPYLLSRLEIADKALEEYTEDEQHCARCDGMTYDTGNGKIAREALQQIRS